MESYSTWKSTAVEVEKPNEFKSSILPQAFATLAACLFGMTMGITEAYTSPAIPSMEETGAFGHITSTIQARIASFALLAACVSGPPVGFLIEKIGRKTVIMMSAIPFATGYMLIAAASDLNMVYIGRLMTGFCTGAASLVVPIFIGEIAEDRVRGLLSSMFQLNVTIGNCFVYILGTFVDWQYLAAACAVFPVVGLLLLFWTPGSPRYLLSKGKEEEAKAALMWFRGANNIEDVEPELRSIQSNLAKSAKKKSTLREIFKMKSIKPMIICLFLLFFQQLTGIEAILVYTVHLFREGGSHMDPHVCTIIVGSLQVVATLISALIVDKAGRRKLIIISLFGTCLSMLALALYFYFKSFDETISARFGWIPLGSLATFIIFFAFGAGPVPFLLVAELNNPFMVGFVSSLATTINWGCGYLVSYFLIYIQESIGLHFCFLIFSVVSFTGVIFSYFFVPETKNRSMEEIQKYFQKVQINGISTVSKSVSNA